MNDLATRLEEIAETGVTGITLRPLDDPRAQRRVRSRRVRSRRVVAAVAGLCLVVAAIAIAGSLRSPGSHRPTLRGGSGLVADAVYTVPSEAMVPTLDVGDQVSVASKFGSIERGDVVRLRLPGTSDTGFKRVIGLPGETVAGGRDGAVRLNGRALVEPYVSGLTSTFSPVKIPPHTYWLLGDNRGNSKDSRVWGPVPASSILGIALRVTAPEPRAGAIAGSPRHGGVSGSDRGLPVHRPGQAPAADPVQPS